MPHWADREPHERPVRPVEAGDGKAVAQPRRLSERVSIPTVPKAPPAVENESGGEPVAASAPSKLRVEAPEPPLDVPSREVLVQLALDTYKLALDNETAYVNRRGEEKTRTAPDFRAACEAIRVAAQIAGYTLRGGEPGKAGAVGEKDAETALRDMAKLRARMAVKK